MTVLVKAASSELFDVVAAVGDRAEDSVAIAAIVAVIKLDHP